MAGSHSPEPVRSQAWASLAAALDRSGELPIRVMSLPAVSAVLVAAEQVLLVEDRDRMTGQPIERPDLFGPQVVQIPTNDEFHTGTCRAAAQALGLDVDEVCGGECRW